MRISGTESSSVILSETKYYNVVVKKLKGDAKKRKNQAKATRDCEIDPQDYNFNQC